MRLFEIVNRPLYLCMTQKHLAGDTLIPSRNYPLGAALEGKLEMRRPAGALARDQSFYLLTEPSDAAYVYMVEPIGQVDRHHTSWLKLLSDTSLSNLGEIDSYAGGYWSGKPWPEDQDAPYQLRSSEVRILKRVGGWER